MAEQRLFLAAATPASVGSAAIAPPLGFQDPPCAASGDSATTSASPSGQEASGASVQTALPTLAHQASNKAKGRGRAKAKAKQARMKWTNAMVEKLLKLRFDNDGEVRRKIETADTNVKKALAWQYFATVLSEELHVVVSSDQLTSKYRKMKCEYRKRKRDMRATGNNPLDPMDETYWAILHDGFASHTGISGDVIYDTNTDDMADEGDASEGEDTAVSKDEKKPPIVQLAVAMQTGMQAIAKSMASSSERSDNLDALIETLNVQHTENLRVQEQQIALLKLLAEKLQK